MDRPVGIFDSGVGGLTVASAIRKELPGEDFIYYGDTQHAPYGDKSASTITAYSRRITRFLLEQHCKCIVIACNSASAAAYENLRQEFPQISWLNVVQPSTRWVHQQGFTKVGVIATRATIESRVYEKQLKALHPGLEVASKATPLLAPLVEEGFAGTSVSREVIDAYLTDPHFRHIQALILGCTHYPLLQTQLEDYYHGEVAVLDSAQGVAQALRDQLSQARMVNPAATGRMRFYVSENTPAFQQIARLFFGHSIELEERRLPF